MESQAHAATASIIMHIQATMHTNTYTHKHIHTQPHTHTHSYVHIFLGTYRTDECTKFRMLECSFKGLGK